MALLTLAQLKAFTNIGSSTSDTEMQLYVDSVTEVVEAMLGGPVEERSITEYAETSDYGRVIRLRKRFVKSVTSLSFGGAAQALTGVYVAPGNVLRRAAGYGFTGPDPVQVTYVAGVAPVGQVPAALTLAAAIIAGHLWETQRGSAGPSGPSDEEYASINTVTPGLGFAVPNRALELMRPWAMQTSLVLA